MRETFVRLGAEELTGKISMNSSDWAQVGETTFAEFMVGIAEKVGVAYDHEEGFGGQRAFISNCQISMYITKEEMSFEEAQEKFLNKLLGFSGPFEMETNYEGYSEFTILDYCLEECRIGGHDINKILLEHIGEYANIRIEVYNKGVQL